MTGEPLTEGEEADLVADAHSIAETLKSIDKGQGRNRILSLGVIASTSVMVLALIVLAILFQPVIRTARTVESVASPDALRRSAASGAASLTLVLCKQRENTSEARIVDGKPPLVQKKECPLYNFDPNAPILPPEFLPPSPVSTPTTTKPTTKPKRTTTTKLPNVSVVPPATTPVTSTTQAFRCPTPTLPIVTTCLTLPGPRR